MQSNSKTIPEYLESLSEDRKEPFQKLRNTIVKNLPQGFEERLTYGVPGYVVPHSVFPNGYHCDPKLPLGFMAIASQKNFIAIYHMGVYANRELLEWFVSEFPKHSKYKLDMGKSCIRFKKMDAIPFDLIGELCTKMTVQDWISLYENNVKS